MAELLRREHGADRVSVARIDHGDATFEILASAGKALLGPGLRVPVALSTQIDLPAHGRAFAEPSFTDSAGWGRPIDILMLGLGFSSGCSLALGPPGRPVGALSLSCTRPHRDYDASLEALRCVADVVAERLDHAVRAPGVLVCHDDDLLAEGLARSIERRLGVRTRSCRAVADIPGAAPGEQPDIVLCAGHLAARALQAGARPGGAGALIVLASHDSPYDRQIAVRAGAAAYAVLDGDGPGVLEAIAAVAAGQAALPPGLGRGEAIAALTPREADVLLDLDDGLRYKDVARRRGITELTAKTYARSLFRKLGATSRTEAVNAARASGQLDALRRAAGPPAP
ncbi:helix-turn-helix transcriptional regulator [Baekduia soli]|nr:helix-turn-helix transcriptional regulator [Baekduia soli]